MAASSTVRSQLSLPHPGKRICVIGTSGAGKTYVAMALAAALDLEYVSNDAIIWRPNWEPTPDGERLAAFREALVGESWTFDGNLSLRREEDRFVLDRCETLVWLDLPRWQVQGQVLARTLRRLVMRERLWHDNVERWSTAFSADSIVLWSIKTFRRRRREYGAIFETPEFAAKTRIRLRSRGEVRRWLSTL
jgi:adenylate kinase family enzyme